MYNMHKNIFSEFRQWESNLRIEQEIVKRQRGGAQKICSFIVYIKLDTEVQITPFYFFGLRFEHFWI